MRTKTNRDRSPVKCIITGTAIGLALTVMIIFAFSFFLTKKDVDIKYLPIFLYIAGGLGSFISAFINTKKLHIRGIYSGFLSSLIFSGIYLLICFTASGFSSSAHLFVIIPVCITAGVVGAVLSKNIG